MWEVNQHKNGVLVTRGTEKYDMKFVFDQSNNLILTMEEGQIFKQCNTELYIKKD